MLAIAVTGFAAQAHAVSFDDLLQEVNNLKQQVFDLRTQLGAAVLKSGASLNVSKASINTVDTTPNQWPVFDTGPCSNPNGGTGPCPSTKLNTNSSVTPNQWPVFDTGPCSNPNGGTGPCPSTNPGTSGSTISTQPTPGISFSHSLTIGEKGPEVKKLQDVLVSKGYLASDNATGLYGKVTAAAVMALQRANGINDDGTVVGPKTQLLLNGGASAQAQIPTGTGTPASSILPPGCTSFNGFSPINGQPCGANIQVAQIGWVCQFNPNAAPKLKVTSPDGGEIYTAGQQITVTWKTCSIPSSAYVDIFLTMPGINQGVNLTHTLNDGSQVVTLPSTSTWGQMVYGLNYKITIVGAATDASDNLFTINAPVQQACGIFTPTIGGNSTQAQYVAAGNTGAVDGTRMTLFVSPTGGSPVITELKFTENGLSTITSVKVGNVTAPVVSGVAWLTGLNIPVVNSGVFIDVYVSYSSVGISGIPSNRTSSIALTYAKYTCGGATTIITPTVFAPTMTLVGSKPTVTVNSTVVNGLLVGAENKIGQVTITADVKGNIKINDLAFIYGLANFSSLTMSNLRIADGANTVLGSSCGISDVTDSIFCEFATTGNTMSSGNTSFNTESNMDFDGYTISAGTSKTFNLYATLTGTSNGAGMVSTSLNQYGFNWDDTATATFVGDNISATGSGTNLGGQLIYNFPTGSYSIRQ